MRKAAIVAAILMFCGTISADNGGWISGVGIYDDSSELSAFIAYSSTGNVTGCSVQPWCGNSEYPQAVSLGPGETPESSSGFSPWSGYAPCQAITHAEAFTCPMSINDSPSPAPVIPVGGPDIQTQ